MNRLLVCTLILVATLGWAADQENRFALVIGNAAYEGSAVLANPVNDAQDMAEALGQIGWKVTKVVNANRNEMNQAVDRFHDLVTDSPGATVLFFYAGHGIQIDGQNYLLPVGETFETSDQVTHDALALQVVLDSFSDAGAATDVVILDACRDNPFVKANGRSLGGSRGLTIETKAKKVEGTAILFSTAPGQIAADGGGRNGVYTQVLLKYLTADIPLQLLTGRISGEVKRVTGGKQVPFSSLSLSDDFYLVPDALRSAARSSDMAANTPGGAPSGDTSILRASLVLQKGILVQQKIDLQAQGSWVGWLGGSGWVVTGLGAGTIGLGWFLSESALGAYRSATNQAGWDSARGQLDTANLCLDIGLVVAGTGLAAGISSLFLAPDTSAVDRKLRDVDQKLASVGGL